MKTKLNLRLLGLVLGVGSILGAESGMRDEINQSVLPEVPGYAWTTTVSPQNSRARLISIDGKAEKNGPVSLTLRFGDRTVQGYLYGNKAFVTSPDTKWKAVPEMEKGETPGQFMDRMVRGVTPPAKEIVRLTKVAGELRKEGDVFVGELPEGGARGLVESRRRGPRNEEPELKNASGSVKFWTKEGAINKYEFTVRGKTMVAGKETDFDQTTVVEIKEVGTARVEVPEHVKQKLGIP